jgi:hypothetical protein
VNLNPSRNCDSNLRLRRLKQSRWRQWHRTRSGQPATTRSAGRAAAKPRLEICHLKKCGLIKKDPAMSAGSLKSNSKGRYLNSVKLSTATAAGNDQSEWPRMQNVPADRDVFPHVIRIIWQSTLGKHPLDSFVDQIHLLIA